MSTGSSELILSELQHQVLDRLVRSGKTPQYLAERARIVLMSAEGKPYVEQARILGVDAQRVRRWRHRWVAAAEKLTLAESGDRRDLADTVADVLDDAFRSGAPCRFTAEQVAQIIALACEKPEDSGRPVSHWTPRELADEAIKRQIVDSISPRHVDRFLKGGRDQAPQVAVLAQRQNQGKRPRGLRR